MLFFDDSAPLPLIQMNFGIKYRLDSKMIFWHNMGPLVEILLPSSPGTFCSDQKVSKFSAGADRRISGCVPTVSTTTTRRLRDPHVLICSGPQLVVAASAESVELTPPPAGFRQLDLATAPREQCITQCSQGRDKQRGSATECHS